MFWYLFAPCLIEHRGICHSGKAVYSYLSLREGGVFVFVIQGRRCIRICHSGKAVYSYLSFRVAVYSYLSLREGGVFVFVIQGRRCIRICHSGKAVYSLLLNMISMGKQREFRERRWPSPLAEFLTGSHIIL